MNNLKSPPFQGRSFDPDDCKGVVMVCESIRKRLLGAILVLSLTLPACQNGQQRAPRTGPAHYSSRAPHLIGAHADPETLPSHWRDYTPYASIKQSENKDRLPEVRPPTQTSHAQFRETKESTETFLARFVQASTSSNSIVQIRSAWMINRQGERIPVSGRRALMQIQGLNQNEQAEVWIRPPGGDWHLVQTAVLDETSWLEARLHEDGVHDVLIRPVQDESAPAPSKETKPTTRLLVDTTPPVITRWEHASEVTNEKAIHLSWEVEDDNLLADQPVSLFWSTKENGPWQVIGERLPASGEKRWESQSPGAIYLRLEAVDVVGNPVTLVREPVLSKAGVGSILPSTIPPPPTLRAPTPDSR